MGVHACHGPGSVLSIVVYVSMSLLMYYSHTSLSVCMCLSRIICSWLSMWIWCITALQHCANVRSVYVRTAYGIFCFIFWFWIHTASETSTAETHTDGGAVIKKPGSAWFEGIPAISITFMLYFIIDVMDLISGCYLYLCLLIPPKPTVSCICEAAHTLSCMCLCYCNVYIYLANLCSLYAMVLIQGHCCLLRYTDNIQYDCDANNTHQLIIRYETRSSTAVQIATLCKKGDTCIQELKQEVAALFNLGNQDMNDFVLLHEGTSSELEDSATLSSLQLHDVIVMRMSMAYKR